MKLLGFLRQKRSKPETVEQKMVRYKRYLTEEVRRVLGNYLGNRVAGVEQELMVESEAEADRRISRDPRIMEIPLFLQPKAVHVILVAIALAMVEARYNLAMLRHKIGLMVLNDEKLLSLYATISSAFWPFEMEYHSQMEPPALPSPPAMAARTSKEVVEESKKRERVKSLSRQLRSRWLARLSRQIGILICSVMDSSLTCLVVIACFEGTEWYFWALPYIITASVVVSMLYLAHQMVHSKKFGKIGFYVVSLVLGYVRVTASDNNHNLVVIALAFLTVVAVPVLAYLSIAFYESAKKISGEIESLQKKIERLMFPFWVSKRADAAIQRETAENRQIMDNYTKALIAAEASFDRRRRELMETKLTQINRQVVDSGEAMSRTLNWVRAETLTQMAPTLWEYSQYLALMNVGVDILNEKEVEDNVQEDQPGSVSSPGPGTDIISALGV